MGDVLHRTLDLLLTTPAGPVTRFYRALDLLLTAPAKLFYGIYRVLGRVVILINVLYYPLKRCFNERQNIFTSNTTPYPPRV